MWSNISELQRDSRHFWNRGERNLKLLWWNSSKFVISNFGYKVPDCEHPSRIQEGLEITERNKRKNIVLISCIGTRKCYREHGKLNPVK